MQALEQFEYLKTARPGDGEVVKMLARLSHQMEQPERAVKYLELFLRDYRHCQI